jgi:hypothetical protein
LSSVSILVFCQDLGFYSWGTLHLLLFLSSNCSQVFLLLGGYYWVPAKAAFPYLTDPKTEVTKTTSLENTQHDDPTFPKVLLFITTHFSPAHQAHLQKCWPHSIAKSKLLQRSDIFVFSTGPVNQTLIESVFSRNRIFVHEEPNPGYHQGAILGLKLAGEYGWFDNYDWVIRSNPDVLIKNETEILNILLDPDIDGIFMNCYTPPFVRLHTDWSAFRPRALPQNPFTSSIVYAEEAFTEDMQPILESEKFAWLPFSYTDSPGSCRVVGDVVVHLHLFPDCEDEIDEPSIMMKTRSMFFMGKILFEVYADKSYSIEWCNFFRPDIHPGLQQLVYHFVTCQDDQLGDKLGKHYGGYALANAAELPYTMTCGDESTNRPYQSILAILQVDVSPSGPSPTDAFGETYNALEICQSGSVPDGNYPVGVDLVSDIIRQDMWRVVEVDTANNGFFEPDDAVIHIQLGGSLYSSSGQHEHDALIPHRSYSLLIEQATLERGPILSISIIITFLEGSDLNEDMDERSILVAHNLYKHLEETFPDANVTMYSTHIEPASRAYSRLVRAKKVSICGPATFCTFPVLGNRDAIGYILNGENYTLNPWSVRAAYKYENINIFSAPALGNAYIEGLSNHDLLVWLNHQNPSIGYVSIRDNPLMRYH